ncbi:hypothetical protein Anapl_13666 [Anas platyrhynchos]|uniref:Uncharacterized protein n=1 Tax=Anas platyrhynchos TaxID=8839 RepID=R0LUY3_ANAPL|nr:hypothetical protein Anapl_13666 [Anas platyrhynchos]
MEQFSGCFIYTSKYVVTPSLDVVCVATDIALAELWRTEAQPRQQESQLLFNSQCWQQQGLRHECVLLHPPDAKHPGLLCLPGGDVNYTCPTTAAVQSLWLAGRRPEGAAKRWVMIRRCCRNYCCPSLPRQQRAKWPCVVYGQQCYEGLQVPSKPQSPACHQYGVRVLQRDPLTDHITLKRLTFNHFYASLSNSASSVESKNLLTISLQLEPTVSMGEAEMQL